MIIAPLYIKEHKRGCAGLAASIKTVNPHMRDNLISEYITRILEAK